MDELDLTPTVNPLLSPPGGLCSFKHFRGGEGGGGFKEREAYLI